MIFITLTFLAALLIEGLGTATSVIGLSALFGANPIIIALAIALDLGKIVVVSLLYKYWSTLGKIMKSYALIAAFITMVITSAGAGGYLMGEFQKAIIGTQEGGLKVEVLKTEQAKLEARKIQIDDQIAKLPEKYTATQRIRMINQFKDEQKQVTARLMEISKELPDLQVKQIGTEAKAGPILTIAKSFDIPVESAIKYVILMIIFVFDPLAVFLIIAGNFLVEQRKKSLASVEPTPEPTPPANKIDPSVLYGDPAPPTAEEVAQNIETNKDFYDSLLKNVAPVEPPITKEVVEEVAEPEKKVYDDMHPRIIDLATPAVVEAPAPEPVEEPTPPIYEVLQPSPGVVDLITEPAPVTVTQTPTPPSYRTEINLSDVTAPSEITLNSLKAPRVTLADAPDNGDVTFDAQPSGARTVYQGQRR